MPSLHDVSTVYISVTDVNDNRPVFTHPSPPDNATAVIQLTSSVVVGHVVTQVTADDADSGVNAQLRYSIINDVSDDAAQLFVIDAESGEVRVAASLLPYTDDDAVTYNLLISVSDAGSPSLTSHAELHVVVSDSVAARPLISSSVLIDMTWWLVAGVCLAAGLLTFITLCLIIGVNQQRRRRKRRTRNHTTTSTSTTPPQGRAACNLSRRKAQVPPPLALMTDVDPLTSAMLRRHQYDDVTLLHQPDGLRTGGNYINYTDNVAVCDEVSCKSAPVSSSLTCCVCCYVFLLYPVNDFVIK